MFKSIAPFISCLSKINNTFIGNAEELDIAMSMFHLLEYSDKYSLTSGSLCNYYRDDVKHDANENNAENTFRLNIRKTTTSKSLKCKTKIIVSTPSDKNKFNRGFIPLKFLNSFWRSFHSSLINCKINLDLHHQETAQFFKY